MVNLRIEARRRYPAFDPYHEPETPSMDDVLREIRIAKQTGERFEFPVELSDRTTLLSEGESLSSYLARREALGAEVA